MKVVTVVGARPQFVKLQPVSRALRERGVEEYVLHTGQHYDFVMSESFFRVLDLPKPDYNLGVRNGDQVSRLAEMVGSIGKVLKSVAPELVLVFGDTDSTLAGALAASVLSIPVGHIEAGMRSFNRAMPEERNRLVADALSSVLFVASRTAETRLREECVQGEVVLVGDTMLDVVLWARSIAEQHSRILEELRLREREYVVATVHRAENTDSLDRLDGILDGLASIELPVILPLHPRTKAAIQGAGWEHRLQTGGISALGAVPYLDMLRLVKGARCVFTDSGGLQKESFYLGVPCITLRDETEWPETVEAGWNRLAGASASRIEEMYRTIDDISRDERITPYGDGTAGVAIAEAVVRWSSRTVR